MGTKLRTIGFRTLIVTVPIAGIAVPISTEKLFVTDFELHVKAANSGTNMYISDKNVNNTRTPRLKGTTWLFRSGEGRLIGPNPDIAFDLSKIYLNADANGDTAIIEYFAIDRD